MSNLLQKMLKPWMTQRVGDSLPVKARNQLPSWAGRYGSLSDFVSGFLSGSGINFAAKAGKIYDNATVFPAISWYWRNLQSARIIVQERVYTPSNNVVWKEVIDHDFILALANSEQDETTIWFGTLLSWFVRGNVYWYKLVNQSGEVIGYQYIPNNQIRPMNDLYNDGTKAITYYLFTTQDGKQYRIKPEYIVHLKYGIDPLNPHMGLSPMESSLREIVGDNTAATIGVALLSNAGIAGVALVPKMGVMEELTEAERLDFTTRWKENTTGDSAGSPNLLPFPVEVVQLGYKPSDLVLDKQRKEAVSRILATFGIDPMVLGFASEQKTYSNFGEALEAAWETGLLPVMNILAKQLTKHTLWDFEIRTTQMRISWDTSEVRALQEDEEKKWNRARQAWRDGMITRMDAKIIVRQEFDKTRDDVYIHDVLHDPVSGADKEKMREQYDKTRRKRTKVEDGDVEKDA